MAQFDTENFIDSVINILKANLDTEIGLINSEKGGSISLPLIPSDHYSFMMLPDELNRTPWISIGIENPIQTETVGPVMSQEVTALIVIGHSGFLGNHSIENVNRLFMRYTEAIKRTILKNFQEIGGYSLVKISQLPFPVQIAEEDNEEIRIVGVSITAAFSS